MTLVQAIKLAVALVFLSEAVAEPSRAAAPAPHQTFRDPVAQQFRTAIASSNLDAVQKLSQAAATNDCLELDEQGRTALHYATRQCTGNVTDPKPFEILKLLAGRGSCVNTPDRLGRRAILELEPLSWADRSKVDALNILLANGADVNAPDENGATILHQILRVWDNSSLHLPDLLEILVKAKVNPNLADVTGQTPLHYFFGRHGFCSIHEAGLATRIAVAQKVFTLLSEAGASWTLPNNEGTTPVGEMLAQYEPYMGTKEAIFGFALPSFAKSLAVDAARIQKRPALVFLCDRNHADPDLIARLLELGADPKRTEDDGFTALHAAAWFYNYQICDLLVQRGANVNALNRERRTPLHELARSAYLHSSFLETDRGADILKAAGVLLAQGANRSLRDQDGKTAFDLLKTASADNDMQAEVRALKKRLKP